ncbi:hypothetical protein NLG97_g5519 [Lecanicillium saksenae]|uniref:Uncharacterized protein n=1 Tax=Lecanicillium saksenae TaxID=468837 RepID=A0ACC1QUT3_9HYPO|nr:hypothetical protein NLG97_g5519 [Lecanicillium saksenae]
MDATLSLRLPKEGPLAVSAYGYERDDSFRIIIPFVDWRVAAPLQCPALGGLDDRTTLATTAKLHYENDRRVRPPVIPRVHLSRNAVGCIQADWGIANFTFRMTLLSGVAPRQSLILEHARPCIAAAGPDWEFSSDLQVIEAERLWLWDETGTLYS